MQSLVLGSVLLMLAALEGQIESDSLTSATSNTAEVFVKLGIEHEALLKQEETKTRIEQQAQFWEAFQGLSGKSFSGKVVHAPKADTTFSDKTLTMHVREATDERIAIHFFVGDDRSRTWLLTRVENRIQLKHDHRHQDGTEDEVTQYGGLAANTGSENRQVFPADQATATLLPAAASNVWWIDISPGEHYTYSMQRLGTDRYFSVKFDLQKVIPTPGNAWGWE